MFLRYAFPSFVMTRMLARRQFEDGYGLNRSDDAFNRCFLVCISPGNKENHQIIQQYLDDMGFVPSEWLLCSDLKVNNIVDSWGPRPNSHVTHAPGIVARKRTQPLFFFYNYPMKNLLLNTHMQTYAHTRTYTCTHTGTCRENPGPPTTPRP